MTVRLHHGLSLLIFLLLGLGTAWFGLRVFAPKPYQESPKPQYGYDLGAMQTAVDWTQVKAEQDRIVAFGSRFLGQPGADATAEYLRRAFQQAGLEVHEQENWTLAPKTMVREVYRVGASAQAPYGERLSDVEIFPFMPNHLQPIATADEGIVGRLVLLTTDTLQTRPRFDDCIGLIDASDGRVPPDYAFDWTRYAQLGLKGLIVAHPEGLEKIPWQRVALQIGGMVSSVPVNYARLAASAEVFRHVGETIRLRVQVKFENTRNTTLIGVLRAGGAAQRKANSNALVVLSNYDACSILPDRAPGVMQAISPATQLALLKGLSRYRDSLVYDVVFVAMGAQMMGRDGDNNLLRLLDENIDSADDNPLKQALRFKSQGSAADEAETLKARQAGRLKPWLDKQAENEAQLKRVQTIQARFADPFFLTDPSATAKALSGLDPKTRAFCDEQLGYVLNALVFDLSEPQLQAKLRWMESGDRRPQGPLFQRFQQAKREYDGAVAVAGTGILNLLDPAKKHGPFLAAHQLRQRWQERFAELLEHHQRRQRQLTKDIDVVKVFNPYRQMIIFDNKLLPTYDPARRAEVLSFSNGDWVVGPQMRSMVSLFASARQRLLGLAGNDRLKSELAIPPLGKYHNQDVDRHTVPDLDKSSVMWLRFGYLIFTLLNFDRSESYQHLADPVDLPYMRDIESLRLSLKVVGESLLSIAHGNGKFAPVQIGWLKKQIGGRVLAENVGQSMVPNFPLKNAVLASRSYLTWERYAFPGYYIHPLIQTDVYGRYELVNNASDFWVDHYTWAKGYSPVAAAYDREGRITWIKDEGEDGQRLYKSVSLNWFDCDIKNITVVAFRAAPVTLCDLTNPQTMRDYTGLGLLKRESLAAFRKQCLFDSNSLRVSFLEPNEYFYATLESGSPGNDLAKVVRGFLLGLPRPGTTASYRMDPSKEIDGPGYLAATTPFLLGVPFEMARSMNYLNGRRLAQQSRHGMADERTQDYQQKARELSKESDTAKLPFSSAALKARESVTYSTINHPVLRASVFEAVLGILWYLALLVPFVFFFEKMVFCFTDVRRQIAAQALIFMTVFVLLRFLHPAFEMVRSSLMILLGFIIILISGGMTLLFSGKFKENLEELKKRRGQVEAAEINTLGVMGSAFMLGLNNMHRRQMRTGLTCATLTLMTFAMICFTSIQSSVVDEATAIGKAPYQGLLIKRENFKKITDAELFAIKSRYAQKFSVCPRMMYLGIQNWQNKQGYNPEIEMLFQHEGKARSVRVGSILQFTHDEPLQSQIRMLTRTRWFSAAQDNATTGPCPVFISDAMAESLNIPVESVNQGGVRVQLNGRDFEIQGIFDSNALDALRDLDGRDIRPYDVQSMARIQLQDEEVVATESDPRMPARSLVLCPFRKLDIQVPNSGKVPLTVSVALSIPQGTYKAVRGEIDAYLEQSGKAAFYGLDGVAWRGRRAREASLGGLLDMLIPLLIAALTVLNTMKGSVYERRGEIYVYNAVGIAPRYVFFMFFAEAFVYSVVGSVLGYLLSQGTGWLLTTMNWTGGLNMTFTSLTTIYASLAIAAAVFISTWFPARSAMEIAKPAEEAGWGLPEPVGGKLTFDLPFTFDARDRIAILAFFERYLQDHGEGGSGRYFAGEISLGLSKELDPLEDQGYIPRISASIWLKPFDLGVSQHLEICLLTDPETREYKARVTLKCLSGTHEAWMRLNHPFVAELRRHFLHWRAVGHEDRQQLFEEAHRLLRLAAGMEQV